MKDYLDIIGRRLEGYEGPHTRLMEDLPHLYILVNQLVTREVLPPRQRIFAVAVVGYFTISDDALSVHDFGPDGYLDDAYVCCTVLRHFLHVLGAEDLYEFWGGSGDLRELLGTPFDALSEELGKRGRRALNFAGIGPYLEIEPT